MARTMWVPSSLLGLVLLRGLLAPSLAAAGCTDYSGYTRVVGSVDLPGQALCVAVSGAYAYVGAAVPGVQVIDISDPEKPTVVASLDTPGLALGIAISGSYAYVADHGSGLEVVDISNPVKPRIVGHVATVCSADEVAVSGNRVYLGESTSYPEWDGALEVIDVTNPLNPQALGHVDLTENVSGVAVMGGYVYVAGFEIGLNVVDVTNPASPRIVGGMVWSSTATDVALTSTHAYVATGSGVKVVDTADPANPQLVGEVHTTGYCHSISIAGSQAYVTETRSEWPPKGLFQAIDIVDPRAPRIIANQIFENTACDAVLSGEHVYLTDDMGGLQVILVDQLLHPPIAGGVDTPHFAADVAVSGAYAFVADSLSGLQVIDVADPAHPRIVGSAAPQGAALNVELYGHYAYVGVVDGGWGLSVIDVAEPTSPAVVGFVPTHTVPRAMLVDGVYGYVAECTGHDPLTSVLQVFDLTQPEAPQAVGTMMFPGEEATYSMAISGRYLYVTAWHGLYVVDVADPRNSTIVTHLPGMPHLTGIVVVGTRAFAADSDYGLRVIDLADPENPAMAGGVATPYQVGAIAVSGDYAYLSGARIQVVDLSSPESPTLIGRAEMPEQQVSLSVADHYVLLACGYLGLTIMQMQCEEVTAVPPRDEFAGAMSLRCLPNPNSGRTTIHLVASKGGWAQARIYDPAGRLIRSLPRQLVDPGDHDLSWDGRDDSGREVAQGMYLVRVSAGESEETARVVILK